MEATINYSLCCCPLKGDGNEVYVCFGKQAEPGLNTLEHILNNYFQLRWQYERTINHTSQLSADNNIRLLEGSQVFRTEKKRQKGKKTGRQKDKKTKRQRPKREFDIVTSG